jgi:hypothetical protein
MKIADWFERSRQKTLIVCATACAVLIVAASILLRGFLQYQFDESTGYAGAGETALAMCSTEPSASSAGDVFFVSCGGLY